MKKIAVILSGCGFKDGAEIAEAVSALIALSSKGRLSLLCTRHECGRRQSLNR
ncbi:MAG: hypothetical protein R2827_12025 [Bdellovibrionales bacterium]